VTGATVTVTLTSGRASILSFHAFRGAVSPAFRASAGRNGSGFTLVEVLVAVAVVSVGLVLVLRAMNASLAAMEAVRSSSIAGHLTVERAGALRIAASSGTSISLMSGSEDIESTLDGLKWRRQTDLETEINGGSNALFVVRVRLGRADSDREYERRFYVGGAK